MNGFATHSKLISPLIVAGIRVKCKLQLAAFDLHLKRPAVSTDFLIVLMRDSLMVDKLEVVILPLSVTARIKLDNE